MAVLLFSLVSFFDGIFFPISALWSFWYPRESSKRACGHMTSWMWLSSTLLVIWTCCVASKICRPGKCIIQYVFFCYYIPVDGSGEGARAYPSSIWWRQGTLLNGDLMWAFSIHYLAQGYLSRALKVFWHLALLPEHHQVLSALDLEPRTLHFSVQCPTDWAFSPN